MVKNSRIMLVIMLIVLLTIFIWGIMAISWAESEETVIDGIIVDDIDLGGLTYQEAREKLEAKTSQLLQKEVLLLHGTRKFVYSFKELGVTIPIKETLQEIIVYGQRGSFFRRVQEWWGLHSGAKNINLSFQWDETNIRKQVEKIASVIDSPPKNAMREIKGDTVEVIPHLLGQKVDVEQTVKDLIKLIPLKGRGYVPVTVIPQIPEVTTFVLRKQGVDTLMAKYITQFNPYNKPRVENIRVASAQLDGTEIAPGEVFSFNDTVGPRTVERGYKEAIIIVGNDFVPGVGGGVCQVSSTLYNGVLRANLPVIERRRHSLLINYVPLGLDATVAYGHKDFKFVNNTDGYIILKAEVSNDSLTVRLFGRPVGVEVMLKSIVERKIPYQTIVKEDAEILQGKTFKEQKGTNGYHVRVEKSVIKDGATLSSEVISEDRYPVQNEIIRVGTMEVSN